MDTTSYDVVIVGAGVAGALAARRIKESKSQARVLLVDAGDNGIDDAQRAAFVDAYQLSAAKSVPSPNTALRRPGPGAVRLPAGEPLTRSATARTARAGPARESLSAVATAPR